MSTKVTEFTVRLWSVISKPNLELNMGLTFFYIQ